MGSAWLLPLGSTIAAPMAAMLGAGDAFWEAAASTVLSTLLVLAPRCIRDLPARMTTASRAATP